MEILLKNKLNVRDDTNDHHTTGPLQAENFTSKNTTITTVPPGKYPSIIKKSVKYTEIAMPNNLVKNSFRLFYPPRPDNQINN